MIIADSIGDAAKARLDSIPRRQRACAASIRAPLVLLASLLPNVTVVAYKRDSGKLGGNEPKSLGRMTQLPEKGDVPHKIGQRTEKSAFQILSS